MCWVCVCKCTCVECMCVYIMYLIYMCGCVVGEVTALLWRSLGILWRWYCWPSCWWLPPPTCGCAGLTNLQVRTRHCCEMFRKVIGRSLTKVGVWVWNGIGKWYPLTHTHSRAAIWDSYTDTNGVHDLFVGIRVSISIFSLMQIIILIKKILNFVFVPGIQLIIKWGLLIELGAVSFKTSVSKNMGSFQHWWLKEKRL